MGISVGRLAPGPCVSRTSRMGLGLNLLTLLAFGLSFTLSVLGIEPRGGEGKRRVTAVYYVRHVRSGQVAPAALGWLLEFVGRCIQGQPGLQLAVVAPDGHVVGEPLEHLFLTIRRSSCL